MSIKTKKELKEKLQKLFTDFCCEDDVICKIPVVEFRLGLNKNNKKIPKKMRKYDYIITYFEDGFYNLEKRECQQYYALTPYRKVKDPQKIYNLIKALKEIEI
jgi:hypothetical protein